MGSLVEQQVAVKINWHLIKHCFTKAGTFDFHVSKILAWPEELTMSGVRNTYTLGTAPRNATILPSLT